MPEGHQHHFERPTHHFEDPVAWSKVFDDPARDEWQKPVEVIERLKLAPDATVADIGAGTGYFTVRLARAVPQGKVLAVDVEPPLLEYIAERAEREKISNVETRLAPPDRPDLPAGIDVILVVNTYHHIGGRPTYFSEARAALKPTGRLVIIDWRPGPQEHGPPERHKLPPEAVTQELAQAGFTKCGEWDGLTQQYFLVYGVNC